jgi:uncharacterized membrane protein
LALLPIILTVTVTGWLIGIVAAYVGPGSTIGRLLTALGISVGSSESAPYLIGVAIILLAIFALGLVMESHVWAWISAGLDRLFRKIPVVSTVYELSTRVVSLLKSKDGDDLKSMSAVWCFFGGEPGAAVLALMPNAAPVRLGNEYYLGILVPTAPVPVGGGLIYVPAKWVRPADCGVDHLMNVYVTMGVTAPMSSAPPRVPA